MWKDKKKRKNKNTLKWSTYAIIQKNFRIANRYNKLNKDTKVTWEDWIKTIEQI